MLSAQLATEAIDTPGPRIATTLACTAGVNCASAMRAIKSWPSGPQPYMGRAVAKRKIRADFCMKNQGSTVQKRDIASQKRAIGRGQSGQISFAYIVHGTNPLARRVVFK